MSASLPVPVVWTRQHARLWTGRRAGSPVGTVEQGRRFIVTGLDGVVRGGFRTLRGAQDAVESSQGRARRLRRRPLAVLLGPALATAAAACGGLLLLRL